MPENAVANRTPAAARRRSQASAKPRPGPDARAPDRGDRGLGHRRERGGDAVVVLGHRAHRLLGAGAQRLGVLAEVLADAEGGPGGGQDDGADLRVLADVLERVAQGDLELGGQRVATVRAVHPHGRHGRLVVTGHHDRVVRHRTHSSRSPSPPGIMLPVRCGRGRGVGRTAERARRTPEPGLPSLAGDPLAGDVPGVPAGALDGARSHRGADGGSATRRSGRRDAVVVLSARRAARRWRAGGDLHGDRDGVLARSPAERCLDATCALALRQAGQLRATSVPRGRSPSPG